MEKVVKLRIAIEVYKHVLVYEFGELTASNLETYSKITGIVWLLFQCYF